MSTYHITRVVKEGYTVEANSRDEAIRKVNRTKPDSAITLQYHIQEAPNEGRDPGDGARWPPLGPGPWGG